MTNELILLIYIAVALTVNVLMNFFIYVESVARRREYVDSINRLCNLLGEELDRKNN